MLRDFEDTSIGLVTLKERVLKEQTTSKLTGAEKRVLNLVSLAMTNKEIAAVLGISLSTVKRHLENLLRKLGVRNRIEAAIYGLTLASGADALCHICPLEVWQRKRNRADQKWAI